MAAITSRVAIAAVAFVVGLLAVSSIYDTPVTSAKIGSPTAKTTTAAAVDAAPLYARAQAARTTATRSTSYGDSYTISTGVYKISWVITDANITFTLKANVTGWLSVGFNTSPKMVGGDVYVGWVGSTGAVTLFDAYATAYSLPYQDTSQGGSSGISSTSGSKVRGENKEVAWAGLGRPTN